MTRLLLLAGAAVLSVAASAAQAQPRPDPANLFAKADANHDGLVIRAESRRRSSRGSTGSIVTATGPCRKKTSPPACAQCTRNCRP